MKIACARPVASSKSISQFASSMTGASDRQACRDVRKAHRPEADRAGDGSGATRRRAANENGACSSTIIGIALERS